MICVIDLASLRPPFSMDAFKVSIFQLLGSLERSIWINLIPLDWRGDGGSPPYRYFWCTWYVENMGGVCCLVAFGRLLTTFYSTNAFTSCRVNI